MNSENSKASDPHRLRLDLADNINFQRDDRHVALSELIIYCTCMNIKKSYKNN